MSESPWEQDGDSSYLERGDPPPPPPVPPWVTGDDAARTAGAMLPSGPPEDASDPLSREQARTENQDLTERERALAANLARRQENRRLLERLANADFCGADWDYFANDLAAYALPVLMSWTRTGKIARLCALKGRPIRPAPPDWTFEDRSSIVTMTIAVALNRFRDRLRKDGWSPDGGATLTTYFIGAVILQYPNQFNRWLDERRRVRELTGPAPVTDAAGNVILITPRSDDDPARTAINHVYLAYLLDDMPPALAEACRLMYTGHTQREAADAAGRTEGALGEQLRRYREKKKREGDQ
ncbi:hypothetical protein OHR68_29930 [Spirillospora sp. NBC_00431]